LARDLGELRTVSTGTSLKSAAPEVASAGSDPNATFIETSPAAQTGLTAAAQPPARVVAPKSKSNSLLVLTAAAVAMIGAGSWYTLRHKETPAVQVTPPPSVAASETSPAPAPTIATADESVAKHAAGASEPATLVPKVPVAGKPAAGAPKKTETYGAAAEKAPPPKAEASPPEPAALDFNPKSLDPKANAKLKIEADRMPASLDFTVEMNGKLYLRRSAEGNKTEFDDLYVPPGVQEFRVTAGSGSVRKSSNTVSTEFKAKKRHTLKIELRTQGNPQGTGTPQGLYADTQIVLTLK